MVNTSLWPSSFSFLFCVFSVLDLEWFGGWIERAYCNIGKFTCN